VQVHSTYIPERSLPDEGRFFFAYRIRIWNEGSETVQLISRHWIITDGDGETEEVRGPGVVGQQPVLECGQVFEYTSFCPLSTPLGCMRGFFHMIYPEDGENFEVEVGMFTLAVPEMLN
jgi:ApaG protein